MEINVRKATEQDYEAVCGIVAEVDTLHAQHLPRHFQAHEGPARTREHYLGVLADETAGLFIAERAGRVIGFLKALVKEAPPFAIMTPRRYVNIDEVGVRADCQRSGVGRALMEHAHRWACEHGATSVELSVYAFNAGAIAFYRELGYDVLSHKMEIVL
jgi:diamine N-acetyltransferase